MCSAEQLVQGLGHLVIERTPCQAEGAEVELSGDPALQPRYAIGTGHGVGQLHGLYQLGQAIGVVASLG